MALSRKLQMLGGGTTRKAQLQQAHQGQAHHLLPFNPRRAEECMSARGVNQIRQNAANNWRRLTSNVHNVVCCKVVASAPVQTAHKRHRVIQIAVQRHNFMCQ